MLVGRTDRWFAEWFNDDYLNVYAHRDEREARSIADLIDARIPDLPRGLTLDLGCGAGRHLPYLRKRQRTVGLDLSPWLLDVAKRSHPETPLIRADMRRVPFRAETFSLVVSLFTSFGYFIDDAQNRHVLREIARVTSDDGWLVLDFLNALHTRRSVVRHDRRQVGETWIQQSREISGDGRYISKTIRLGPDAKVYTERVRLFEPGELAVMLADCGFRIAAICGDYTGAPLTMTSPRAIVLARRSAGM